MGLLLNPKYLPVKLKISLFILVAVVFISLDFSYSGAHGSYPPAVNHDSPYPARNYTVPLSSLQGSSDCLGDEGNNGGITENRLNSFPSGELNGLFTLEKYIFDTVINEGDGGFYWMENVQSFLTRLLIIWT